MSNLFQKATKQQIKLRLALLGPAGSGKTYTALQVARFLGGKTALMDTEHRSARKYADLFDFDVVEPESFAPEVYIEMIKAAEAAGYDIMILDSLSHAWAGKGGILEFVDEEKRKSRSGNAFTDGWGKATPKHNALIEAMLSCKMHLIVTMRTKMEYVIEEDPTTHKKAPRKIGLQPVQRDGLEYEFDVVGDLNQDNEYNITKTRCPALTGKLIPKPGKELADILNAWLTSGAPAPEPEKPRPAPATEQEQKATTTSQPPLNGSPRPYPPEILKTRLEERANTHKNQLVSKAQRNLVAMLFGEIFAGPDSELQRHAVQQYLFGKASLKDIPDPVIKTILDDWLKPEQDAGGAYHADPTAVKEALAAYTAAIEAQGQQSLGI